MKRFLRVTLKIKGTYFFVGVTKKFVGSLFEVDAVNVIGLTVGCLADKQFNIHQKYLKNQKF